MTEYILDRQIIIAARSIGNVGEKVTPAQLTRRLESVIVERQLGRVVAEVDPAEVKAEKPVADKSMAGRKQNYENKGKKKLGG